MPQQQLPKSNEDDDRDHGVSIRLSILEKQVIVLEQWMKLGISGGAASELQRASRNLEKLETRVDGLEKKTTRWEGGGYVLTATCAVIGMAIGWVASKLGLIK